MDEQLLAFRAADGSTVVLERYPLLLGRAVAGRPAPDVDFTHLDPRQTVAERHCQLEREGQEVTVRDLGSAEGTWVDGRRLPPGGRAPLRRGSALRLGEISVTVSSAPGRPRPPLEGPSLRESRWGEGLHGGPVPPPPSAGESQESWVRPQPQPGGLDLSAAPQMARDLLEGGADALRLLAGELPQLRIMGSWSAKGQPLSALAMEEAIAVARRVLGLGEDAEWGRGEVGDVSLDFVAPPLASRQYLGVRVLRRDAAEIGWEELSRIGDLVLAGSTLLVSAPWPEPALAALATQLDRSANRPMALNLGREGWWIPAGWPRLEPTQLLLALSCGASPLFVDRPSAKAMLELLPALPRLDGGTVIGAAAASPQAVLEQLATLGGGQEQRSELLRSFPLCLHPSGQRWELSRVGLDAAGRWQLNSEEEG